MASELEIEQILEVVTSLLNEQQLEEFDPARAQMLLTAALGGVASIRVDDGGGLHDEAGRRIGVIRRTPSGEWITEHQNRQAPGAGTDVPAKDDRA